MKPRKKAQTEEELFREQLAECPYLYGVQKYWSRFYTRLSMTTLEMSTLLRPCEPADLDNKLEIFVYHVTEEIRARQGLAASTNIDYIWYFVGGRNLAYEISKVAWDASVLDIVIAHRHPHVQGPGWRMKVPYYQAVEVHRGRDINRVRGMLKQAKNRAPVLASEVLLP